MQIITSKMLENQVQVINGMSNEKYSIHHNYTGYQLKKDGKDIFENSSGCYLTSEEMFFYLLGLIHGLTKRILA